MTDGQLVQALRQAQQVERAARAYWQAPQTVATERMAALEVVRHQTVVIRDLEKWIAARAVGESV